MKKIICFVLIVSLCSVIMLGLCSCEKEQECTEIEVPIYSNLCCEKLHAGDSSASSVNQWLSQNGEGVLIEQIEVIDSGSYTYVFIFYRCVIGYELVTVTK